MTELDIPDEYDAESFRAGYAIAMREVAETAEAHATLVDGLEADTGDDEDDEDETCSCGRKMIREMGSKGLICPACDV